MYLYATPSPITYETTYYLRNLSWNFLKTFESNTSIKISQNGAIKPSGESIFCVEHYIEGQYYSIQDIDYS